jgi:hypothetical protein
VTRARTAALVAALLGASACARHAAGPSDTLAAFGAAIERKDYAAAYDLTSKDFRARVPLAAFRAGLEDGGGETQGLGRQLRAESGKRPLRVEVELDLGQPVSVVEEGGAWRIDGAPYEPWSQRTPRAALRSFVRALEQRRYDIVLRLAPARHRAGLTVDSLRAYWEGAGKEGNAENAAMLARLRAAIRAPIIETGDEAHMPYAERAEVLFVREDGAWKIEDPD